MSYKEACRLIGKGIIPAKELTTVGELFTHVGANLEVNDDAWRALWDDELVRGISYIGVPRRFNPYPLTVTGDISFELHISFVEFLSRFDASALMALPGPSLSGHVVKAIGSDQQITDYFSKYSSQPARAFLAVTEPTVGSDVGGMMSTLHNRDGKIVLNAEKTLVGGVSPDSKGLLLARVESRPELRFLILDTALCSENISIKRLRTVGLAGAQLCRLSVNDVQLEPAQILGENRADFRSGMYQLKCVFQRHRPMVAAMAIGTARGAIDTLQTTGVTCASIDSLKMEYDTLLHWLKSVAQHLDQGDSRFYEISLLKFHATRFAERTAQIIPTLVPPKALLQMPALARRYRDLFAFEYMEGTSNIHRINAYHTYIASRQPQ